MEVQSQTVAEAKSAAVPSYGKLLVVVAIVAVLAAATTGAWVVYADRPMAQFQAGLDAISQKNWRLVRHEAHVLETEAGYEAHHHYLMGVWRIEQHTLDQTRKALVDLQIALDSDDTRLGANVRLGQAYWSLDEFQQAVQHLNEAVLEDPSNVDGRRWLAVVYNDLGADQLALENFSIWAQLAPDDGRPFRGMGMIYEGMQNYPDAIRNYRQSLDLTTDEADRVDIVLDLAECYHKDLKHARAIEHLLELPPTGDVLALRAQCEHGLGNTDVAQAAAEQALAVTPDHLGALVVKGTVATERDDAKTAIETLEHARQLYPSEYTVRFLLAQAYERFGEPQKAEEERGRAERLRVMREDHARLVQEAMVDVSNFEIRYELGQLARQLGMPEAAYFWFLSARALNPGHVPTLQALNEMAQAAAGDIPGNDATVAPSSAPDEKKLPDAGATKPSSQLQIPASGTG